MLEFENEFLVWVWVRVQTHVAYQWSTCNKTIDLDVGSGQAKMRKKQKCIPVGCIPTVAVGDGCLRMHPSQADTPSIPHPPLYHIRSMPHPHLYHPPLCHSPPVDRVTHACENITFPAMLRYTVGNNWFTHGPLTTSVKLNLQQETGTRTEVYRMHIMFDCFHKNMRIDTFHIDYNWLVIKYQYKYCKMWRHPISIVRMIRHY